MEDLVKIQTKLKETEMALSSLKISTKAIKKMNNDNEERSNTINSELIKLALENEKNLREASTNKKLLQLTKGECDAHINDLQKKFSEQQQKLNQEEQLINMKKEDALSESMRFKEKYDNCYMLYIALVEENKSNIKKVQTLATSQEGLNNVMHKELVVREELEMTLDEYKDLFNHSDKENKRLTKELQELDKDLRKADREDKKKAKEIGELKGYQERCKKAEKRISELLSKMEIKTFEMGTQMKATTSEKHQNTDLTRAQIKQQEVDLLMTKKELHESNLKIKQLESDIIELDADTKKRLLTGINSNPESARDLSPKYRSRLAAHTSHDFTKSMMGGKSFEHVDEIHNEVIRMINFIFHLYLKSWVYE